MATPKTSIFDFADKFGYNSPFGTDWVAEEAEKRAEREAQRKRDKTSGKKPGLWIACTKIGQVFQFRNGSVVQENINNNTWIAEVLRCLTEIRKITSGKLLIDSLSDNPDRHFAIVDVPITENQQGLIFYIDPQGNGVIAANAIESMKQRFGSISPIDALTNEFMHAYQLFFGEITKNRYDVNTEFASDLLSRAIIYGLSMAGDQAAATYYRDSVEGYGGTNMDEKYRLIITAESFSQSNYDEAFEVYLSTKRGRDYKSQHEKAGRKRTNIAIANLFPLV